jgi:hypothetical protein
MLPIITVTVSGLTFTSSIDSEGAAGCATAVGTAPDEAEADVSGAVVSGAAAEPQATPTKTSIINTVNEITLDVLNKLSTIFTITNPPEAFPNPLILII